MTRIVYLIIAVNLGLVLTAVRAEECGECHEDRCLPPKNCLAGMVKDRCECCFVCGRREAESCDGESLPLPYRNKELGKCGENLVCKPRTDLAPGDPPQAHCVCERTDTLCGSDGQTYDNECQLTEARYKLRDGLKAMHRGPCKSAPKIVSPPEDAANVTGGHIAMSCEVIGWPIPTVEWRVDRGTGDTLPLPSDDPRTAVQSRGGPTKYEVTGWLQKLQLQKDDEAAYWCIAKNEEGEASASARIIVLDKHDAYSSRDTVNNDL